MHAPNLPRAALAASGPAVPWLGTSDSDHYAPSCGGIEDTITPKVAV